MKPEILESNGVRLNSRTREVMCDGLPVDVTPIEYDILEALVQSAGQVVSRDQLARYLETRGANPFGEALDAQVNELRRKLERGRRLIRSVEGVGYLFAAADENMPGGYRLA